MLGDVFRSVPEVKVQFVGTRWLNRFLNMREIEKKKTTEFNIRVDCTQECRASPEVGWSIISAFVIHGLTGGSFILLYIMFYLFRFVTTATSGKAGILNPTIIDLAFLHTSHLSPFTLFFCNLMKPGTNSKLENEVIRCALVLPKFLNQFTDVFSHVFYFVHLNFNVVPTTRFCSRFIITLRLQIQQLSLSLP